MIRYLIPYSIAGGTLAAGLYWTHGVPASLFAVSAFSILWVAVTIILDCAGGEPYAAEDIGYHESNAPIPVWDWKPYSGPTGDPGPTKAKGGAGLPHDRQTVTGHSTPA